MSAGPALPPPTIRRAKALTSRASTTQGSMLATPRRSRPFRPRSIGSMCWCWRQGRGSTAAYHATKGNPSYNASKTGAVGLTRTLGEAWAEDGIRVNGIAPGLVDTKLTKVTTANPVRLGGAGQNIPLRRLGTPADMAGAALFLASPLASYIVGQTIVVDGGLIL